MSAPVDATARRDSIVAGLGTQLRAAIRRVLAAYRARRDEEAAIAHLSTMSDRELRDIGMSRSEIPFAVRRRVPRDRAVRSYL